MNCSAAYKMFSLLLKPMPLSITADYLPILLIPIYL